MADVHALSSDEIERRLSEHPEWKLGQGCIERSLLFGDFVEAFGFMTSVALVAEQANHHPDWTNVYNRVAIRLSTHDVGGISDRDFELASRIDVIAARCG